MKKITAYKATDGKIFENEGECRVHDNNLNIKKALAKFGDTNFFSGMDSETVEGILFEHRKELADILLADILGKNF